MRQAAKKLEELELISDAVVEIESKYNGSKEKINQYDLVTSNSGLTIQVVRNCCKALRKLLSGND